MTWDELAEAWAVIREHGDVTDFASMTVHNGVPAIYIVQADNPHKTGVFLSRAEAEALRDALNELLPEKNVPLDDLKRELGIGTQCLKCKAWVAPKEDMDGNRYCPECRAGLGCEG